MIPNGKSFRNRLRTHTHTNTHSHIKAPQRANMKCVLTFNNVYIHTLYYDTCIRGGLRSDLYPGLPPWEEKTEIVWVCCLLNELVDLTANAKRYAILNPF